MDLTEKRQYSGIVSIGKHIYVFGANYSTTAETYNGFSWKSLPNMPFEAYGLMCVAYKGNVTIYDETDRNFCHFYPEKQEYRLVAL